MTIAFHTRTEGNLLWCILHLTQRPAKKKSVPPPQAMLTNEQFYMKHIYPVELMARMITMEDIFPHQAVRRRQMATLGRSTIAWWHCEEKRTVSTAQELRELLREKSAFQLHLSRLVFHSNDEQFEVREAVFDVDVTDFTRFCPCAALPTEELRKSVCSHCWLHIEGASLLLHHLLVYRLGIPEHALMWVLSGKKGFHCVVNDTRLLYATEKQRDALLLLLHMQSTEALRRFARTLDDDFVADLRSTFTERCILTRHLLAEAKFEAFALQLVRDNYPGLYSALALAWHNVEARASVDRSLLSMEKWRALERLEFATSGGGGEADTPSLLLMLACYYPVVDSGPMRLKRLFKAPFSVHDATMKISLPVAREEILNYSLPTEMLSVDAVVDAVQRGEGVPAQYQRALSNLDLWLRHKEQ
jgi:DNA primase catalytic subunit